MATSANLLKSRTRGRLYPCDTLLEGLAQDLQDVAAALRQLMHLAGTAPDPAVQGDAVGSHDLVPLAADREDVANAAETRSRGPGRTPSAPLSALSPER